MGAWDMHREGTSWHESPLALLYSVLTGILLGAVITDVTYAATLRGVLTPDQKAHVYGIVSDSMLTMLVAFSAVLAGIAGALLAGINRRARWALGISVALLTGGNILVPMVMPQVRVDDSPGVGPLLRVLLHTAVLVLGMLACLSWRRPTRHS
jgi:hypothetical protein